MILCAFYAGTLIVVEGGVDEDGYCFRIDAGCSDITGYANIEKFWVLDVETF